MLTKFAAHILALSAHSHAIAAPQFMGKAVPYPVGTLQMEGYQVGSGTKGSILVVHDWMGITDKTKTKADALAALGYQVFAADIFGKNVRPKTSSEAKANSAQYYKDRKLFRDRLNAGLELLKSISNKQPIAAVGYCFGGTGVIELARSGAELNAVISFHGGLDSPTPADGKNIKARVLALHGADDPLVPADNLNAFEQEMRTHSIDWQLIKYGGAVHSFTDPTAGNDPKKGAAYNPLADKRSWQAMQNFLTESFALVK